MKIKKYFKTTSTLMLLSASTMILSSCAKEISSGVYSAHQVGEVSVTYSGVIRNVREVCIEGSDNLEENGLGIIGGGVVGGVVGSNIGKGNGRLLPTAVGAIAGAVGGSLIEKKLKQQTGFEYIVHLDDGMLMTIVQGRDYFFQVGQPVYVITSNSGRSRITPQ